MAAGGPDILTEENRQDGKKHFYDVEWFQYVYSQTLNRRGRLGRIVGRVAWSLDSFQGFFVAMLGPVLGFGVFLTVIVGLIYGPLVFLGLFGGLIGGLALVVEKKVGRSLQFGDYSFWKRSLAQAAALGLALGVIFLLVFLSKFRPF